MIKFKTNLMLLLGKAFISIRGGCSNNFSGWGNGIEFYKFKLAVYAILKRGWRY